MVPRRPASASISSRRASGRARAELASFEGAGPRCEHCLVRRARRQTFIVAEAHGGTLRQVGRSCLRAYTGKAQAVPVAALLSELEELRSELEREREPGRIAVEAFLARAACVIRLEGYRAGASPGRRPRRTTARSRMVRRGLRSPRTPIASGPSAPCAGRALSLAGAMTCSQRSRRQPRSRSSRRAPLECSPTRRSPTARLGGVRSRESVRRPRSSARPAAAGTSRSCSSTRHVCRRGLGREHAAAVRLPRGGRAAARVARGALAGHLGRRAQGCSRPVQDDAP